MKPHRIYCSSPVAPNLLERQFHFERPNQAWVGDITYIPTDEVWLYLSMVKDLCTRKIVGYAFSNRIDTKLTLDALDTAIRWERPQPGLIFHSDRGVQYAANAYQQRLEEVGFIQSMSRKGNPYDNEDTLLAITNNIDTSGSRCYTVLYRYL